MTNGTKWYEKDTALTPGQERHKARLALAREVWTSFSTKDRAKLLRLDHDLSGGMGDLFLELSQEDAAQHAVKK